MLRVIGAGFGRTGTFSLKTALDLLGYGPTYHMAEVFAHPEDVAVWQAVAEGKPVDWDDLFDGYQSAVDWPASAVYRELMDVYPDAKVILTTRDPQKWHESGLNTIFPGDGTASDEESAERRAHRRMVATLLWDGIFHGRVREREYAIDIFNQHIDRVKAEVPSERLLVYDVAEGWEPLCAFLGVPMPADESFPRLNDTESFRARVAERRQAPSVGHGTV